MTLEEALRGAKGVTKLNLFRNRNRGGWEAAIARDFSINTFSVGIDEDPVKAITKALDASQLRIPSSKNKAKDVISNLPETESKLISRPEKSLFDID